MSQRAGHGIITLPKLAPNDKKGQTIPEGRWCLHTTSTVPWVLVQSGRGARVITWGEVVEVSSQGQVVNVSAHRGDVQLAPVLDTVVSARPATYILPADFSIDSNDPNTIVSQWLDVRGARRAYLAINNGDANPLPVPVTIEHRNQPPENAPGIASSIPAGPTAGTGGIIAEVRTINTVRRYSLGYQARDVAPGDPTPHSLMAAVRFRATGQLQILTQDPFFSVEF